MPLKESKGVANKLISSNNSKKKRFVKTRKKWSDLEAFRRSPTFCEEIKSVLFKIRKAGGQGRAHAKDDMFLCHPIARLVSLTDLLGSVLAVTAQSERLTI